MTELFRMTAAEIAAAIRAGEVSAAEVTGAHLARIEQVEPQVRAFLHVAADQAREAASTVDRRRAAGEELGPLAGVPLALKDVFTTKDMPTTCGSAILDGWLPPYDATITRRLREAGVVILGKTNMDEFAMGSSTENSAFGPSHNPWDLDRVPGGSSGGSSAAVAAFEAPLGIGTDTGGSIRQPGAVCGVVGVKPTYGGNSRYGVVAFASSLDTPGPLARTVLDAALLHEVMSGHDPCDATSIDAPVPPVVAAARQADVSGMVIGVVPELAGEGIQPGVLARFNESVELLESLGAKVTEVSCPDFSYALPAYYLINPSECSSNLARFASPDPATPPHFAARHQASPFASFSSGYPRRASRAASTAAPTRYIRSSASTGAMICSPVGRPSSGASPFGTDSAALPDRSDGIVHRSARYMAIGSSTRSPSGNAVVGVVGETSTSTRSKAASKSLLIRVRTCCALP